MAKLTDAQIYTLRRLSNGSDYRVQGNGKRAFERRKEYRVGFDDINAPSIPPLMRSGMVEIDPRYTKPNASSYYPVRLTVKGLEAARTLKVSTEKANG